MVPGLRPSAPRHVAVAGAGIAGVAAADALVHAGHRVTLVAADAPAATALAALVNPFTGPRASPAWRYEASLSALDAFLARLGTGLVHSLMPGLVPGLVRPARDAKQAHAFRARAAAHPEALAWHDDAPPPGVAAPFGWLHVRVGGVWRHTAQDLARHLDRLAAQGLRRVHGTVTGFSVAGDRVTSGTTTLAASDAPHGVRLALASGDVLDADAAVLAVGPSLRTIVPGLAERLHAVKGEVFAARHPRADALVPVAAGGYAVPMGDGLIHLGGTYDHGTGGAMPDLVPDLARGEALRLRMAACVPELGALASDVPDAARAGLRVQRPYVRRPLLVPLDAMGLVWAMGGFGAKGLLHAPYVASLLPAALDAPGSAPDDLAG